MYNGWIVIFFKTTTIHTQSHTDTMYIFLYKLYRGWNSMGVYQRKCTEGLKKKNDKNEKKEE